MWNIHFYTDNGRGVEPTGEAVMQAHNIKAVVKTLCKTLTDDTLYYEKDDSIKGTGYFIYSKLDETVFITAYKYN